MVEEFVCPAQDDVGDGHPVRIAGSGSNPVPFGLEDLREDVREASPVINLALPRVSDAKLIRPEAAKVSELSVDAAKRR